MTLAVNMQPAVEAVVSVPSEVINPEGLAARLKKASNTSIPVHFLREAGLFVAKLPYYFLKGLLYVGRIILQIVFVVPTAVGVGIGSFCVNAHRINKEMSGKPAKQRIDGIINKGSFKSGEQVYKSVCVLLDGIDQVTLRKHFHK
ncbi:hypothetical protein [Candidatus Regiella endosymbiont of Tuberolachnus salignus]|uniref:hypothetical protein n=1 Tax=Candidatus Regiella endosymbiont of Tuberolachnus salignus TaxID=3077956 RepID=UPI0030CF4931